MSLVIDILPGFDLTNLTSSSIEIGVGIGLGILIFLLDRRNAKKQEKIISKIEKYTETQERGNHLNKINTLTKIGLNLTKFYTNYKRELLKLNLNNLSAEDQLLQKNTLLKNIQTNSLVTTIQQDGFSISHLTELGSLAAVFGSMFQMFAMSKNKEDDIYFKEKFNLSADYFIEDAVQLSTAINAYLEKEIRKKQ